MPTTKVDVLAALDNVRQMVVDMEVPVPVDPLPAEPILREVGNINVTGQGKVIEKMLVRGVIRGTNAPGITIKDTRVEAPVGAGHVIALSGCDSPKIQNVYARVMNVSARRLPVEQRALHLSHCNNLDLMRFMMRDTGSIYLYRSHWSSLQQIAAFDTHCHELNRGGDPRGYSGQMIQWNESNDGKLFDFSVINDLNKASTVDNVSVHASSRIRIERGLIDGNTDPTGVGVMVEAGSMDVVVKDVDMIRGCNGAFSVYQRSAAMFENCRSMGFYTQAKESRVVKNASGTWVFNGDYRPSSGANPPHYGTHFVTDPSSGGGPSVGRFRNCAYHGNGNRSWRDDVMVEKGFVRLDAPFTPRPAIVLEGVPFQ